MRRNIYECSLHIYFGGVKLESVIPGSVCTALSGAMGALAQSNFQNKFTWGRSYASLHPTESKFRYKFSQLAALHLSSAADYRKTS